MVPISTATEGCHSRSKGYREAKPLPNGILDHCTLCLEEQLYSQAFLLLSNTLTSGLNSDRACHVAPSQHMALAATLSVHPHLTNRARSKDKTASANDALRYLRHANKILGPRNSGISKAFRFASNNASTSRTRRIRARNPDSQVTRDDGDIPDDHDNPGHVRSVYADKESLWSRAEDFWSVLGWALNCSAMRPARWERWRLWLELMLDVLEADLTYSQDVDADEDDEALLAHYLLSVGEGRNNKRRVMRAILADGSSKSLAEFGEVWRNETRGPRVHVNEDGQGAKRRKLDLDNDEFGDYFGDESNDDDSPPPSTARQGRQLRGKSSEDPGSAIKRPPGTISPQAGDTVNTTATTSINVPALKIRKRLLALLYNLSTSHPTIFLSIDELLDLYTEFLRPLPLPLFQAFALPPKPYLSASAQTDLNRMLLRPILAAPAPPPRVEAEALTGAVFEKWYAPFAATSTGAGEGAKCAVLVEGLLRGTLSGEKGEKGEVDTSLVVQGINARQSKVLVRKGKAKEEADAIRGLECSGERMLAWVNLVH